MREILYNIILLGLSMILVSVGLFLIIYILSTLVYAVSSYVIERKSIKDTQEKNDLYIKAGKSVVRRCTNKFTIEAMDSRSKIGQEKREDRIRVRLSDESFHDLTNMDISLFQ